MKELPIACTLGAADRPARAVVLEELRAAVRSVEHTERGFVLRFDPGARGRFTEFVSLEQQCCAFFEFSLLDDSLLWEAPHDAAHIMETLVAFFTDASKGLDALSLL